MSKTRFSTTDTKAMVRDIRATLLGQRVANIYDLNDKTYLFKFAVPGKSEKILLLLESGVRFHTTKYARDKSDLPSPFAMKLRKHIRTRRLEDVKQLCNDRVVDLKFGSGDSVFHIILELYANGNIILTDGNYEILALLRSHQFEEDVAVKVNEIYPMAFATSMDTALLNRMPMLGTNDIPVKADADNTGESVIDEDVLSQTNMLSMDAPELIAWAEQRSADNGAWAASAPTSKSTGGVKKNKVKKMTMRQLLLSRDSGVSSYGPEILDHCLLKAGIRAGVKVADFLIDPEVLDLATAMLVEIKSAESLLQSLDIPGQHGYILYTKSLSTSSPSPLSSNIANSEPSDTQTEMTSKIEQPKEVVQFMDFVPRMFLQHEGQCFLEYPSFDETVDEYYCKVEEQKLERLALSAEEAAKKKVDKVTGEQQGLIATLGLQQRKMEEAALLVELFADDVDKCMLVINSALTAGMDWDAIDSMVKVETARGNAIASLVSRLRLERNIIVLRLHNLYAEDSDEEEGVQEGANKSSSSAKPTESSSRMRTVEVEVDLSMSAYANVARMYGHKKVAQAKEIKTLEASQRALVAVSLQSSKTLESQKIKRNLQAMRKVHWFEKFNWFVTSEGYLVLSGRDAQQNEALVKRYLRPGDVYVHAELHGASSCIVRCRTVRPSAPTNGAAAPAGANSGTPSGFKPISPFALQEAGNMTVCRSGAWGAKIITSAWWVFGTQVSKTAPTGEFLPTGSFMIYGKKNFLSPMPLEMGFGIMFRLDDGSVTRHAGERKDRSTMCDETESVLSEAASRYGIEYGGLGLREVDTDDEGEGSGCGDDELGNDSSGEEGEEEEAKDDGPKAVSIAAFQLTSIAEASDADAEDDEAIEADVYARIENDLVPAVAGMGGATQLSTDPKAHEPQKGGSSRLSARDRRLAKKMKDKGATVEAPVSPPAADAQDTGDDEHEDDAGDTEEVEEEEEEEEEEDEEEAESRPPFPKGTSKANSKNVSSSEDHSQKKGKAAFSKDKVPPTPPPSKKKFVNKKKARRYAGQDGDEKELAMLALGHVQSGEKYGAKEQILKKEKEQKDRVIRQERAGIRLVKDKWSDLMLLLLPGVRVVIEDMVSSSLLKEGELDGQEIRTLATFSEKEALAVIDLFRDGENLSKVGNKSGFLAGIMRRFSKDTQAAAVSSKAVSSSSKARSADALTSDDEEGVSSGTTAPDDTDPAIQGESAMSRRDRKKQEQLEIQNILDEEGILDEEEGKQADEIDKLTGKPTSEDVLLYAVPVCGPYSAIRSFKYSVKLTPGTMKKGKAAKQAIDVFTRGKECSATEKALMRSLTDPEMVAIMIGDIKLSMPGLYQVQRAKKGKR